MTDTETTETDEPTAEQIVEAANLLKSLPEADRRTIAGQLAPPEPGTEGRPLTRAEAREMIATNPEKFHALLDAQKAGGPKILDLGSERGA
ncbi:MAG: hypothetical protein M9964_00460 [Solirubrobacterales bacterium]|nr:hypothetical protein [Thermoleophilales bacterium]MCO5325525.1 hypothetical protein [Solirubrobacterales bacterium]